MEKHLERKEYKKKLKEEINEYIELRDGIRKFKLKHNKVQRAESERKLSAGLKLQKIDSHRAVNEEPSK